MQPQRFDSRSPDAAPEALAAALVLLNEALGSLGSRLSHYEIFVEPRDHELFAPDVGVRVKAYLRGGEALVPVLWQTAQSRGAAIDWAKAALELSKECELVARATALEAPLTCPVVLDPWLASMYIHECIGHTSEADNFLRYARPAGVELGYQWTTYPLQIYDDPTMAAMRGSYETDHEGEPATRVQLVRDGAWSSLLSDARHRALLKLDHAGHARRTSRDLPALPRMAVTYAAAGQSSPGELIGGIDDGLYCGGTWGGGSAGLEFIVRPSWGIRIKNGQLTNEVVRRFDLVGNKLESLRGLTGASTALEFFNPFYGCDKDGQNQLPVTHGAPHLAFARLSLRPVATPSKR